MDCCDKNKINKETKTKKEVKEDFKSEIDSDLKTDNNDIDFKKESVFGLITIMAFVFVELFLRTIIYIFNLINRFYHWIWSKF